MFAVESQVLLNVLAMMRMIPVNARVLEVDAIGESSRQVPRVMGDAGRTVELVLEPHTVPMHALG